MVKVIFVVTLVISIPICLVKARTKQPVHVVLKNVNYQPYPAQVKKKFDVLDLSIYLPKTTPAPRPTISSGILAYENHIASRGSVIQQPTLRNFKSSQQQGYQKGQYSQTAPYFESLSGVTSQKLKAHQGTPFYATATIAPTPAQYIQSHNGQINVRSNPESTRQAFHHNTYLQFPQASQPLSNSKKTTIFYGSHVPIKVPHYESYVTPAPVHFYVTPAPVHVFTNPPIQHLNVVHNVPKTELIRGQNQNTAFFESQTAHHTPNYPHTVYHQPQVYKPQLPAPSVEGLQHQSPVKDVLLNNVVYHDDRYTNLEANDNEDIKNENENEDDDEDDNESYEVREHPQESKKNYQQSLRPFVINVKDTPQQPTARQSSYVQQTTLRPVAQELSQSVPIATKTIARAHLRDSKKRGKTVSPNAAARAITDEIKYFQYANVQGPGTYFAGVRKGNPDHGIETHERALKDMGLYQKRVRWTDKNGGYGEHYWDLAHGKKTS